MTYHPSFARLCRVSLLTRTDSVTRQIPDRSWLRRRLEQLVTEFQLTARELDLTVELHLGLRDKHIADNLGISVRTVSTELRGLYRKLGVTSRQEVVALCMAALHSLEGSGGGGNKVRLRTLGAAPPAP